MQSTPREDDQLVDATLAGDGGAFATLVERYQDRLFGLMRHYTRNSAEIEDLVQETFLKAYRRLDTFQRQSSFSTWIYRIAVNTALDLLKRKGRNPVASVEEPEELLEARATSTVLAPDARLAQQEIVRITHEVLEQLPEIFRTVLVLREFEDMAYQDMADLLGISIGTIESRLFRARARFRAKLIESYPEFAPEESSRRPSRQERE